MPKELTDNVDCYMKKCYNESALVAGLWKFYFLSITWVEPVALDFDVVPTAPGQKLGWLTNYSNVLQEPWLETTFSFVCNTLMNQFSAVLRVCALHLSTLFPLTCTLSYLSLCYHPFLLRLLSLIPLALLPDDLPSLPSSLCILCLCLCDSFIVGVQHWIFSFDQGLEPPQGFCCHLLLPFWFLLLIAIWSPLAALVHQSAMAFLLCSLQIL